MQKLSGAEEDLMQIIWEKGPLFLKDILDAAPEPKPASTTVATLLKRMQDKEFVGYKTFGNSRQYHALVKKEDYFSKHFKKLIKNHFEGSALQFASFFTTTSGLSSSELESLKKIIDDEIKKKKK